MESNSALGNADGTITLARVSDGEVEQTFKDSDAGAVLTLSYRPDGAMIAAAGANGTIRLWDIAEGKKTSAWPAGQGEVHSSVSPGRSMAGQRGQ